MSGFASDTLYALADPKRYDDEYGEGFGHVLSASGVDGCTIADCWIVDADHRRHPGYDRSPVPVRFQDVAPICALDAMRGLRKARRA